MVLTLPRGFADAAGGVAAVMHDMNLTAMLADRIAFLIDGRLAACGSPEEVLQAPLLERAYGCRIAPNRLPACGPWILPQPCAPGP